MTYTQSAPLSPSETDRLGRYPKRYQGYYQGTDSGDWYYLGFCDAYTARQAREILAEQHGMSPDEIKALKV